MTSTRFHERIEYQPGAGYRLLPFRFEPLDGDRYVLTNDVGEYVVLSRTDLDAFASRRLSPESPAYRALKPKHFLYDESSLSSLELLAIKVRSRMDRLAWFTGLHIFVVTLRCDHTCKYCQVSRQTASKTEFDMSKEHARSALDFVFRSPSPSIKIEFQGGEPLLNFDLIRWVVEEATQLNLEHQRDLQFVVATNLSLIDDDILAFCRAHGILLSTSLDGPADLHDAQRLTKNRNSHEMALAGIEKARAALGEHAVAALMTTTAASLERVEDIVDEYVRLGFRGIFLRSLSPYGFAVKKSLTRRYSAEAWVDFYARGLRRVLEVNRSGYMLREDYTAIILQKMFEPLGSQYVDLQSPAGMGIGALVYNYEGSVFASDEGRMLAEMGDNSLRLGHLDTESYEDMMLGDALLEPLRSSMTEGAPMCSDCAFLPYCGADPAFHRATQSDFVGHKAFSAFCEKQKGVLRHLIRLLEEDAEAREILMSWI